MKSFLEVNLDSQWRNVKKKKLHGFLYVINGSGYGKTWLGKWIGNYAQEVLTGVTHVYIPLDFSNGCRFVAQVRIDNYSNFWSIGFDVMNVIPA